MPLGYLLGSIPFGLLVGKLFGGKDVRQHGSGNIGAANVSRTAGPVAGILTLVLDAAKGATAVWIASHLTGQNAAAMMVGGLAALFGHCFSIWLGFKGGKGVATGLGLFAALCPLAALCAFALFVLALLFWRYASLASLMATASMPLLVYFLWAPGLARPLTINIGTLLAAALIFYQHRENLRRLSAGTEPKFSLGRSTDRA
jgi:acyl phosphate:glycerol-3-phosphate acyltransferase